MCAPEAVFKRCGEVELDIYEYANQALNTVLSIDMTDKRYDSMFEMELSLGDVEDLMDYLMYIIDKYTE